MGSFTRIDLRTKEWSWLALSFDARRSEELELVRFDPAYKSPFKMAVPVEISFSKDRVGTVLAFVDAPSKSFVFPLPESAEKVVFNPDRAVLAHSTKKK